MNNIVTETSISTQNETLSKYTKPLLCLTALVNSYKFHELDGTDQTKFIEQYGYWYRLQTDQDAVKVTMIRERTRPEDTYHEYSFEIMKRSVFAHDAITAIYRGPDVTHEELELYRSNEALYLDYAHFPLRKKEEFAEVAELLDTQSFKGMESRRKHNAAQLLLNIAGISLK